MLQHFEPVVSIPDKEIQIGTILKKKKKGIFVNKKKNCYAEQIHLGTG